jgi:D-lactate dehydrogenase (cytochrome)
MIIKTNPDEFQNYLVDASNYRGTAEAVYLPENEKEMVELVQSLNARKTRITVSGNGTGLTGARVPEGGVVISMEKMNKMIEFNAAGKYMRVQPGMLLKDVQDYVENKNMFYPPDPTERNCFIGATVAANSSGARSFQYGPTRNYVIGMRVVLPSGETISIERGTIFASGFTFSFQSDQATPYHFEIPRMTMPDLKNTAGYYCKPDMDLIDLFVGSEGTLGIITELTLKLLPLEEHLLSCIVFFENEEDAFCFIDEARFLSKAASRETCKISARGLEFFDYHALNLLRRDYPTIPEKCCAVWFEQELKNSDDETTELWLNLIRQHHADAEKAWSAIHEKDHKKIQDFRHAISWKVNDLITRRGLRKVGTDVAVPVESFHLFYQWMTNLVKRHNMPYVVYGHFGNCHIHLNMLPQDENALIMANKIYSEICREAVQRKGTVSAEHGIGKLKRDYLSIMYGEEIIRQMAGLKRIFDPNMILNIGNMFEEKYLRLADKNGS